MTPIIIISIVAVLLIIIIIIGYNKLNTTKNQISNALSSLDALFIKRSDLIPNLVTLVKQYMNFEKETLEKITTIRQPLSNNNSNTYLQDNEMSKTMKQLMIQMENYPDLKTNTQFTNLQYSWNEIEEQISAGRRYLSASITDYNNSVTTFPYNMVAAFSGFKKHEWEQATDSQRKNIDAAHLFKN